MARSLVAAALVAACAAQSRSPVTLNEGDVITLLRERIFEDYMPNAYTAAGFLYARNSNKTAFPDISTWIPDAVERIGPFPSFACTFLSNMTSASMLSPAFGGDSGRIGITCFDAPAHTQLASGVGTRRIVTMGSSLTLTPDIIGLPPQTAGLLPLSNSSAWVFSSDAGLQWVPDLRSYGAAFGGVAITGPLPGTVVAVASYNGSIAVSTGSRIYTVNVTFPVLARSAAFVPAPGIPASPTSSILGLALQSQTMLWVADAQYPGDPENQLYRWIYSPSLRAWELDARVMIPLDPRPIISLTAGWRPARSGDGFKLIGATAMLVMAASVDDGSASSADGPRIDFSGILANAPSQFEFLAVAAGPRAVPGASPTPAASAAATASSTPAPGGSPVPGSEFERNEWAPDAVVVLATLAWTVDWALSSAARVAVLRSLAPSGRAISDARAFSISRCTAFPDEHPPGNELPHLARSPLGVYGFVTGFIGAASAPQDDFPSAGSLGCYMLGTSEFQYADIGPLFSREGSAMAPLTLSNTYLTGPGAPAGPLNFRFSSDADGLVDLLPGVATYPRIGFMEVVGGTLYISTRDPFPGGIAVVGSGGRPHEQLPLPVTINLLPGFSVAHAGMGVNGRAPLQFVFEPVDGLIDAFANRTRLWYLDSAAPASGQLFYWARDAPGSSGGLWTLRRAIVLTLKLRFFALAGRRLASGFTLYAASRNYIFTYNSVTGEVRPAYVVSADAAEVILGLNTAPYDPSLATPLPSPSAAPPSASPTRSLQASPSVPTTSHTPTTSASASLSRGASPSNTPVGRTPYDPATDVLVFVAGDLTIGAARPPITSAQPTSIGVFDLRDASFRFRFDLPYTNDAPQLTDVRDRACTASPLGEVADGRMIWLPGGRAIAFSCRTIPANMTAYYDNLQPTIGGVIATLEPGADIYGSWSLIATNLTYATGSLALVDDVGTGLYSASTRSVDANYAGLRLFTPGIDEGGTAVLEGLAIRALNDRGLPVWIMDMEALDAALYVLRLDTGSFGLWSMGSRTPGAPASSRPRSWVPPTQLASFDRPVPGLPLTTFAATSMYGLSITVRNHSSIYVTFSNLAVGIILLSEAANGSWTGSAVALPPGITGLTHDVSKMTLTTENGAEVLWVPFNGETVELWRLYTASHTWVQFEFFDRSLFIRSVLPPYIPYSTPVTPSATPSTGATPSASKTAAATVTNTVSATATRSGTASISGSAAATPTESGSMASSPTASVTMAPSESSTMLPSPTVTPTASMSTGASPSSTGSGSITASLPASPSPTLLPSRSQSGSPSPLPPPSPASTPSGTHSAARTASGTASPSLTPLPTIGCGGERVYRASVRVELTLAVPAANESDAARALLQRSQLPPSILAAFSPPDSLLESRNATASDVSVSPLCLLRLAFAITMLGDDAAAAAREAALMRVQLHELRNAPTGVVLTGLDDDLAMTRNASACAADAWAVTTASGMMGLTGSSGSGDSINGGSQQRIRRLNRAALTVLMQPHGIGVKLHRDILEQHQRGLDEEQLARLLGVHANPRRLQSTTSGLAACGASSSARRQLQGGSSSGSSTVQRITVALNISLEERVMPLDSGSGACASGSPGARRLWGHAAEAMEHEHAQVDAEGFVHRLTNAQRLLQLEAAGIETARVQPIAPSIDVRAVRPPSKWEDSSKQGRPAAAHPWQPRHTAAIGGKGDSSAGSAYQSRRLLDAAVVPPRAELGLSRLAALHASIVNATSSNATALLAQAASAASDVSGTTSMPSLALRLAAAAAAIASASAPEAAELSAAVGAACIASEGIELVAAGIVISPSPSSGAAVVPPETSSGISAAAVAGIIAVVAILVFAVIVALLYRRYRRMRAAILTTAAAAASASALDASDSKAGDEAAEADADDDTGSLSASPPPEPDELDVPAVPPAEVPLPSTATLLEAESVPRPMTVDPSLLQRAAAELVDAVISDFATQDAAADEDFSAVEAEYRARLAAAAAAAATDSSIGGDSGSSADAVAEATAAAGRRSRFQSRSRLHRRVTPELLSVATGVLAASLDLPREMVATLAPAALQAAVDIVNTLADEASEAREAGVAAELDEDDAVRTSTGSALQPLLVEEGSIEAELADTSITAGSGSSGGGDGDGSAARDPLRVRYSSRPDLRAASSAQAITRLASSGAMKHSFAVTTAGRRGGEQAAQHATPLRLNTPSARDALPRQVLTAILATALQATAVHIEQQAGRIVPPIEPARSVRSMRLATVGSIASDMTGDHDAASASSTGEAATDASSSETIAGDSVTTDAATSTAAVPSGAEAGADAATQEPDAGSSSARASRRLPDELLAQVRQLGRAVAVRALRAQSEAMAAAALATKPSEDSAAESDMALAHIAGSSRALLAAAGGARAASRSTGSAVDRDAFAPMPVRGGVGTVGAGGPREPMRNRSRQKMAGLRSGSANKSSVAPLSASAEDAEPLKPRVSRRDRAAAVLRQSFNGDDASSGGAGNADGDAGPLSRGKAGIRRVGSGGRRSNTVDRFRAANPLMLAELAASGKGGATGTAGPVQPAVPTFAAFLAFYAAQALQRAFGCSKLPRWLACGIGGSQAQLNVIDALLAAHMISEGEADASRARAVGSGGAGRSFRKAELDSRKEVQLAHYVKAATETRTAAVQRATAAAAAASAAREPPPRSAPSALFSPGTTGGGGGGAVVNPLRQVQANGASDAITAEASLAGALAPSWVPVLSTAATPPNSRPSRGGENRWFRFSRMSTASGFTAVSDADSEWSGASGTWTEAHTYVPSGRPSLAATVLPAFDAADDSARPSLIGWVPADVAAAVASGGDLASLSWSRSNSARHPLPSVAEGRASAATVGSRAMTSGADLWEDEEEDGAGEEPLSLPNDSSVAAAGRFPATEGFAGSLGAAATAVDSTERSAGSGDLPRSEHAPMSADDAGRTRPPRLSLRSSIRWLVGSSSSAASSGSADLAESQAPAQQLPLQRQRSPFTAAPPPAPLPAPPHLAPTHAPPPPRAAVLPPPPSPHSPAARLPLLAALGPPSSSSSARAAAPPPKPLSLSQSQSESQSRLLLPPPLPASLHQSASSAAGPSRLPPTPLPSKPVATLPPPPPPVSASTMSSALSSSSSSSSSRKAVLYPASGPSRSPSRSP